MQVLMYDHHHSLPFWHEPTQPISVFNSEDMQNYINSEDEKTLKSSQNWVILEALSELPYNLCAHISIFIDPELKTWECPKRVWVQISTPPEEVLPSGIPLINKGNGIQIMKIWDEHANPYELIPQNLWSKVKYDKEFWKKFFTDQINEVKQSFMEERKSYQESVETMDKLLAYF